MDLTDRLLSLDDLVEFDPALLCDAATEETVPTIASLFNEALLDEQMPEEMRHELRLRLADLARRFPEQLLSTAEVAVEG